MIRQWRQLILPGRRLELRVQRPGCWTECITSWYWRNCSKATRLELRKQGLERRGCGEKAAGPALLGCGDHIRA